MDVKIEPPAITVSVVPDKTNVAGIPPQQNQADSLRNRINELWDELNARSANLADDTTTYLAVIYDVDVTERSINKELDLRQYCCYADSVFSQRLRREFNDLRSVSENIKGTSLSGSIDSFKNAMDQFEKKKNASCNKTKILIGVRNNNLFEVDVKNEDTALTPTGKNRTDITTINGKMDTIPLATNEIAYFLVNSPCSLQNSSGFSSIALYYRMRRKPSYTSFLNIRITR